MPLKFRASCFDCQADESAVKCLLNEHNNMARVQLKLCLLDIIMAPLAT